MENYSQSTKISPNSSRHSTPVGKDGWFMNPRKRGRTACSRCKRRKQRCDTDYPTCSNCKKAGVTCDKIDVQDLQDEDRINNYTRTLEEKVASLESRLGQPGHTPTDNNPVGEIVGLLALSSSEAPAYVGSSSGLSLASDLGEMVQSSVWNRFIASMHQQSTYYSTDAAQKATDPSDGESQQNKENPRDRSMNFEPPDDEMGSKILEAYFKRLHSRYPFLNRTYTWHIHEDRWRLAKISREHLTKTDQYAIFKINIVYAIGSTMLQMTDAKRYSYTAPERYYTAALQYAPNMCEPRSVENIEAMVLLVIYHLRTASSHGMWYMLGLAMRTAIDLGMHRRMNETNMDPFTIQMRRRLFWTVYYLERVVSMSLGRPFSISDRHIDLDLPIEIDDDVEDPVLLTAHQVPTQNTSLTFAMHLFKLRRIDSRIQHKIYRADRALSSLRPKMDPLYLELEQWKDSAFLRASASDLDYLMLHYNRAVRLLIQPFLPLLPITDPYYHICVRAAGEICQSHKRLHQTLEYGHSFLAVQTVFMAGITMLYALWTHTDQVWSISMSNDVRACSTVLFVMGERAAWVKKYRDAFEILVNAAMEKLQGNEMARNSGMAELMTARHGVAPMNNPETNIPNTEGYYTAPQVGCSSDAATSYSENGHAVRMALQLAPWIDQTESDTLWIPDFEVLENVAGTYWNQSDTIDLFDAL